MIKNYSQFTNEDLRSKNPRIPDISYDNLKDIHPEILVEYTDDFKISISYNGKLYLDNAFYKALEKDKINKDDIVFENCENVVIYDIPSFTKISDYGAFGSGIKNFSCSECKNITSLEGSPEIVGGYFDCSLCTSISSLKFAPRIVGNDFDCINCHNITSLDGAPEIVGGWLDCSRCLNLTNLGDAPKSISLNFHCRECSDNFVKQAKAKYGDKVRS